MSDILKKQYELNRQIVLLNGKRPIYKNWQNINIDYDLADKHQGNYGWILSDEDLIIDVDLRSGGEESFKKLNDFLRLDHSNTQTPSGGFHIYLKIDNSFKVNKKNFNFPGIDFLSKGHLVAIPPSKGYEIINLKSFKVDEKFHTKLKELNIIFDKKTTSSELVDLEDSGLQYNSVTEDTIKNWLYHIDNNIDNSQWVKVGMALHNWNDILGLQLWEDWSKGGDTYKIGETEKRWRSFKKNKGITAGTLFHIAKLSISLNKLKICKFVEQLEDLADEMNNLPKDTHGIFKYEFKLNYEKLTGKEITSEELEKLLTKNAWYSNWIFVNTHDSYLDLRNFTIHKTKSFNQENNHRIPSLGKGPKELASNYVANENLIRKVNKIEYRPDKEELIFTENNQSILNSFDRSLLPVAKDEYTPGGLKAIELIKKHMKILCNTQEYADILLNWIASNIQNPGKKIRWSPVIESIPGVGKTFFRNLFEACLGEDNINLISPRSILEAYNNWAAGSTVGIFEELKIDGKNRHLVVNSIKPLITDNRLQMNVKYVSAYNIKNVTNYICFTNYKNCIPLDNNERRWFVIFCNIKSMQDLESKIDMKHEEYGKLLHDNLKKYKGEILKWLLEHEIPEEFKNLERAPKTIYQDIMGSIEESNVPGYEEASMLLDTPTKYYSKDFISSKELFDDIKLLNSGLSFSPAMKSEILLKLGFLRYPKTVRIHKGAGRVVWFKPSKELNENNVTTKILIESFNNMVKTNE